LEDDLQSVYSSFVSELRASDRRDLKRLTTAQRIQEFLDETPYSTESRYRCPLSVVQDRRAHCFDGACFAALALLGLGHPPLIIELLPWDDDDHIIALFKRGACFGAVAKSNIVGLRYREPVYRSVRELVMSYFEPYFNLSLYRTLRGYTRPLNLTRFEKLGWTTRDATMEAIADGLDARPQVTLFTPAQVRALTKVDRITYDANLAIADPKGLYQPKQRKGS
jgi:hypothetical protein